LSIAKAIVDRHGGSIGVTSVPGRTEFKVELPQSPGDLHAAAS
jgi:two-component system OmpR family sensor kinase